MKMNVRQILRKHVMCIIVILPFIGCASISKAPKEPPADESRQVSPADIEPESQVSPEEVKPPAPEAEPLQQPDYFVHTVKWPGESLSHIAKWYTGRFRNWKIIAGSNPKLNPDRIFAGNEIRIPEDLLKTRQPMPREFVARFSQKSKKNKSPLRASASPKGVEDLPLFGPKGISE